LESLNREKGGATFSRREREKGLVPILKKKGKTDQGKTQPHGKEKTYTQKEGQSFREKVGISLLILIKEGRRRASH